MSLLKIKGPTWSRRKTKYLLLLGIPLLLVALVLVFMKELNSPAVGTIKQAKAPQPSAAASKSTTDIHYNGKYISFSYPASYEQVPTKLTGNTLESAVFYASDHSQKQVAVSVVRQTLENTSGVSYRRGKPAVYKEESMVNGLVFTSKDMTATAGFERTAFISHEGLVLSISVTDTQKNDRTADFAQIVQSLVWK